MIARPRIGIAVPSYEHIPARFANDLANLVAYTQRAVMPGEVELAMMIGAYVHIARETLLTGFLQWGATHVLWLETDVRFPRESCVRLLHHDVDAVACNCVLRQPPHRFTAVRDGEIIHTDQDSAGIERVDQVGLGVALVRTAPIQRASPPTWFGDAGTLGEDVVFSQRMRSAGIEIYIDHDLSKDTRHMGLIELGVQHAYREYASA